MPAVTMFDSTKESLIDLLRSVRDGKTQLPDFQRGWVWDDDHVRSLLASVSLSFPIGAVMMLQTGNAEMRLKPRTVEGVERHAVSTDPERLILDGQQRITSLFQALYSGRAVDTRDIRGKAIRRWYYVDVAKALDPDADREEAIVGLPEDRILRNFRGEPLPGKDYSTPERECAAELFPLHIVLDTAGLTDWQMRYLQADRQQMEARLNRWNQLLQEVIQRYQQYQVPLILLRKETPKEAVCQVFEKVNTGGVSLNVFELLTATFAADDFNLRDDWTQRERQLRKRPVLQSVENTDLLQAVSLLATWRRRQHAIETGTPPADAPGISCKRRDVLRITLADYQTWVDRVTTGFDTAAKFLMSLKIFDSRDLPYRTQLVPLAATFAALGNNGENDSIRGQLARWYWCGIFGELYGSTIESRFARDLPELLAWVNGGPEPSTVIEANFVAGRLLTLRTRNSAAYKGVHALLMRDGALDFRTGYPYDVQTYFDERIDIHHIFPQAWCKTNGMDPRRCDSIVNKTAISSKTNRMIGGNAPSLYLARLQKSANISDLRMNELLHSHQIDPSLLHSDDFDQFFSTRQEALLRRIEEATGKSTVRSSAEEPDLVTAGYLDDDQGQPDTDGPT
ncbi:MAG: DUF262 domain-containing protein [Gemmataceae bacterium]